MRVEVAFHSTSSVSECPIAIQSTAMADSTENVADGAGLPQSSTKHETKHEFTHKSSEHHAKRMQEVQNADGVLAMHRDVRVKALKAAFSNHYRHFTQASLQLIQSSTSKSVSLPMMKHMASTSQSGD